MKTHPAAELFPMMDDARLAELAASIREHGLKVPIVRCEGMILDGRHRFKACAAASVEPRFVEFDGGNPFEYVWALNGQRRDLDPGQRVAIRIRADRASADYEREQERRREEANRKRSTALVGNQNASKLQAGNSPLSPDNAPSEPDRAHVALAERAGVSEATAARGQSLANKRPDLLAAVAAGIMKLAEATRQIKREEVAQSVEPLPDDKYRVLYADPPWQYSDTRAGLDGYSATAAADHYPTMSVAALSALDVGSLATDDAVLFCWATFPLLVDALEVIRAWGFKYKTAYVWDKERPTFGHYHDASAELLLVCTKGSATPDADKREDQVQRITRTGRHSEKPEEFRALIDRLYTQRSDGAIDRIELFRRGEPPAGWHVWGNEVKAA